MQHELLERREKRILERLVDEPLPVGYYPPFSIWYRVIGHLISRGFVRIFSGNYYISPHGRAALSAQHSRGPSSETPKGGLYYVSHNKTNVLWGPYKTYEEAEEKACRELADSREVEYQVLRKVSKISFPKPKPIVEKY